MKNEIIITIIACSIVFSAIGFLAYNTMNSDKVIPPRTYPPMDIQIIKKPPVVIEDDIEDVLIENLIKNPRTTLHRLDDRTSLEKTITGMHIKSDNKLPWGKIQGTVKNPMPGAPVIIQISKEYDGLPIHVAQVDLINGNVFEYKFRVLSIENEQITRHYEGDYYVEIFKTVFTP